MTDTPLPDEVLPALPGFADVEAAATVVGRYLPPTPVWSYPLLDASVGITVFVKHENVQPTGAFKVRGGLALFATMSPSERAAGVVTASTGNHAQSMAYGAARFGSSAVVVMPQSAPLEKVDTVRAMGARVEIHGPSMTEAVRRAEQLAREEGRRLVSPGNEPAVIAGHATVHHELLTQVPDLDAIVVPIGSGTSAAGACLVAQSMAPTCRVIGVQSSAAPAAHRAWTNGGPATAPCDTRVSGLATGESFDVPQAVLAGGLADFVLVGDDAITMAARLLARQAHTLAEGAGAAALAGLLALPEPPGSRVAVICSGGNASAAEIAALAAT